MSGRTWVPTEWLDECVPTCGASPDEFLARSTEGVLQLAPIDGKDSGWPVTDMLPGQVVEFCWHEDRGYAVLHVAEDGSWHCDPAFDPDTNCITDDDGDILADTLADCVNQMRENDTLEPGTHDLSGWYWSDGIPFRVEVLESGAASFVRVDA